MDGAVPNEKTIPSGAVAATAAAATAAATKIDGAIPNDETILTVAAAAAAAKMDGDVPNDETIPTVAAAAAKMDGAIPNDETTLTSAAKMDGAILNDQTTLTAAAPPGGGGEPAAPQPLSKSARKKLLRNQFYEAKKLEKKAAEKERKRQRADQRRREWEETLAAAPEEEREHLLGQRKEVRRERIEQRADERVAKMQRLRSAAETGQKVVIDLEFAELMAGSEIHSLIQQIMYCYAVNGRCASPAHLWLTGCRGEMGTQLQKLPGFDKWIIEKEQRSYFEAFQDRKEDLIYLTADAEDVLDCLDPKKIYIIGGLVDRNRWKGITMKKAEDQGIRSAKLPIGSYLKMSSSQVLTVNQVVEILVKFLETRDWRSAFFEVIPQRKRDGAEKADAGLDEETEEGGGGEVAEDEEGVVCKKQRLREDGSESVNGKGKDSSEMLQGEAEEEDVQRKQRIDEADNVNAERV